MRNSAILGTLAVLCFSGAASGQSVLKTWLGNSADDEFGYAIRNCGDINNDGRDDVIVGARWDDQNGANSGTVTVYSGLNYAQLYAFKGDTAYDRLGTSVTGLGDINNDGFADFAAGADGDDNSGSSSGSVRVWSGKTGTVLFTVNGPTADDVFGTALARAGDVNSDGFLDIIVGAPGVDTNGFASGMARVISGLNGAVLYTINGATTSDYFGTSVAGLGDVNNDGYSEFAVGAPYADPVGAASGQVKVYSGKTGVVLYTLNGSAAADNFGAVISNAGDVNKDGTADLIVGAPYGDGPAPESGVAKVFNGKTGALLYAFTGDSSTDLFGTSVGSAGDVDGDGHAELIVGSIWDDISGVSSGSAKVFSGKSGLQIFTFSGDVTQQQYGAQVSSAGDVNNDGFDDMLISAYLDDSQGHDAGLMRVISPLPFPVGTYCQGKVNSAGCLPLIATSGTAKASGTGAFTISATKIVANKSGFLFYGLAPANIPFQGGTLCVQVPTRRTLAQNSGSSGTGCTGTFAMNFNAWIQSGIDPQLMAGQEVYGQYFFRDVGSSSGFTNAVTFTINP